MRLFVALYPPPNVLDDVVAQVARLRVGEAAASGINVRLLDRATAHITLAFLGEVPDERLPDVEAALGRAVRRRHVVERRWAAKERRAARRGGDEEASPVVTEVAAPVGPPWLRLGGGGRFGRGRFTVLWVDVLGDVEALHRLARTIRAELRRDRLPYDERPFRPHFTIARPGDRVDRAAVDEDRATLTGYLGPSWPATEMVLVRSHLGPRPLYHHLATWPL